MDKFYGPIGFSETVETVPGVHEERLVEHNYYGDVLRHSSRRSGGQKVIDDLDISNELSILADPYALHHFHSIRYVTWYGTKWKVINVSVVYPRLNLSIGGVYNDR